MNPCTDVDGAKIALGAPLGVFWRYTEPPLALSVLGAQTLDLIVPSLRLECSQPGFAGVFLFFVPELPNCRKQVVPLGLEVVPLLFDAFQLFFEFIYLFFSFGEELLEAFLSLLSGFEL